MDNLYIIESPLQALCALEVSLAKKNESHAIIARLSSGDRARNDKQIIDILSKRKWDFESIIKYSFYNTAMLNNIESKFFLFNIEKKFKNKVSSLYIGEFRSSFMHMVRVTTNSPKVFLLDDGAASVKVIKNYIDKNYYYPYDSFYPMNRLKKTIFKFIYKNHIDIEVMNKKIKILTAFSDQNSNSIEKLEFINIKKLLKGNKSIDNSLVYYYGSKYSEVGIISRDYEYLFLNNIKKFYDDRNKKIVYFAHRDETEEKLNYISEELGFTIVVSDTMAELYLLESEVLPSEISGAYTSVLNNIKVIFPEINLRSFKLEKEQVSQKWRMDIELIYDYYRNLDIPIEK